MSQHRELTPVTVYLPPELIAKLEAIAAGNYSTISAEGRRLIAQALSR